MTHDRRKRGLGLLLCGLLFGGASAAEDRLRHPLMDVTLVGGQVPGIDVHDSPTGGRYAVGDSFKEGPDGRTEATSDVVELPVRPMTAAEHERFVGPHRLRARHVGALPRVTPRLAEAARFARDHDRLDVTVELAASPREPLPWALERLIGSGGVRDRADLELWRRILVRDRARATSRLQEPVVAAIASLGGEVTARCELLPCLVASLPPTAVARLSERSDVLQLDLDRTIELPGIGGGAPPADADPITGTEIAVGTQIRPFLDLGYDGKNRSAPALRAATIEPDYVHDSHPGLGDAPGEPDRIDGRFTCDGTGCRNLGDLPPAATDHAIATTGVLLGDLFDGQDPAVTDPIERGRRSGYAGEARGYLYQANNYTGLQTAFDHLAGRTPKPHLVNLSWGEHEDWNCLGRTALARAANGAYEAGVLPIASAGNRGHTGGCTVTEPAAAIGVFTVGMHGTGHTGGISDVRQGPIHPRSSRGGVSLEDGANRSIIDVTAFGCRSRMFDRSDGYGYQDCGTSFAAPTVGAAALDFVDFYHHQQGAFIDQPGALAANLLLMGDRQAEGETATVGFDNLWGAGRLKMRRWDERGMDEPSMWSTRHVCVRQGEVVSVPINRGQPVEAAADVLKAVVWWYDARHGTGGPVDDVDLRLVDAEGNELALSDDEYDNKERVFSAAVAGKTLKLELIGANVTSDDAGCGPDAMCVYYAWMYEDSARNDTNGPGSEVDPS